LIGRAPAACLPRGMGGPLKVMTKKAVREACKHLARAWSQDGGKLPRKPPARCGGESSIAAQPILTDTQDFRTIWQRG
jgi:hypothetical protein